jgi:ribosomal protein S18 acetylase RimI-like enzyme
LRRRKGRIVSFAGIEHVGVNVRADNRSAVACYERIGFQRVADYGEYTVELNV